MERNKTENRLTHKASKRDLELSEQRLLNIEAHHRFESYEGEIPYENFIKIDNSNLTPEEVAAVSDILNGKQQEMNLQEGIPSCGFNREIAIIIDGTRYALACDKCGTLQNCSNLRYISVSDAERQVLETIFTSRGGKFPCI